MRSKDAIRTRRLTLTPLTVDDAAGMVAVLSDPALYTFTGGEPPTLTELKERYRYQSAGGPGPEEVWYNWILRLDGDAIGFVQATVTGDLADVAWVVGAPWQGHGYASEASTAMRDWLLQRGVTRFSAHIHPEHAASNGVARSLGLTASGERDADGGMIWITRE
ncbi:MAG TPA: GNAT family N-acetyltransferase [Acidimicrobiia bacterium]|jgi:RimJ/RimL family protein N-acetyltransferase